MKKSSRKKLCFFANGDSENCFRANLRNGFSELALLIFTAVFITASVAFVSVKFSPKNDSGEGFIERISGAVLKTFGNVFSSSEEKPALEIDLGKNENAAEKIPVPVPEKIADVKIKNTASENPPTLAPATAPENLPASSSSLEKELIKKIGDCDFSRTGTPNHQIIFSEVNWMGSKDNASDEWIEIKNNSGSDISLYGWQILSADKNIKIIFAGENKIPAGGLYLLERTDDNSATGVTADAIYSGTLSNSGAAMKIFSDDCSVSDEIDASKGWPAGDSAARKTMERSVLDFSWHTSAADGGTPKRENTAAFSRKEPEISLAQPGSAQNNGGTNSSTENQPASSSQSNSQNTQTQNQGGVHILIAEVQITGGSGKTTNDFIKIFNPSSSPFNLKGYRLVRRSASSTSDTSLKSWISDVFIPVNGLYTWANSSFVELAPPPNATTSGSIAAMSSIAIRQGPEDTGTIIDAVAWGVGHLNPLVESFAYTNNPGANQILSRKSANGTLQDTDNNQNDFYIK